MDSFSSLTMREFIQQDNLASDKGKPFEKRGRKAFESKAVPNAAELL